MRRLRRLECGLLRGFTLIELLVVIAIIAILASILFPVFSQAREKARASTCTSNWKNLTLSMNMYSQDYDECMVPLMTSPASFFVFYDPDAGDYVWPELVDPYVKNWQIHRCPSDPDQVDSVLNESWCFRDSNGTWYYCWGIKTDAGYNHVYLSPMNSPAKSIGVPQAIIANPANTLMIVDSTWYHTPSGDADGGGNWFVDPPRPTGCGDNWSCAWWFGGWRVPAVPSSGDYWIKYGGTWPRHHYENLWGRIPPENFPHHNGRMNVGFVGGNVKALQISDLLRGTTFIGNTYPYFAIADFVAYIWDRRA